jgi:hypothetical protein
MASSAQSKAPKPPSTASSTDASSSSESLPMPNVEVVDSMPPTPGQNPFGTPGGSIASRGDMTPTFSTSSRVQSSSSLAYGQGYFPDITTRASGILSVHASSSDLQGFSHARTPSGGAPNPFSSGRSNISGLSGASSVGDITELPRRQNLPPRTQSAIREAFQSPPPRQMSFLGSAPGSTLNVAGTPSRAPAKRLKSTMLTGEIEKPWTKNKDKVAR